MQINLYVLLNQDHNKTYHIKNEKELGSHFKLLEILHFMAELFFFFKYNKSRYNLLMQKQHPTN